MSRSLRSRPLTLYGGPSQEQQQQQPSGPSSSSRDAAAMAPRTSSVIANLPQEAKTGRLKKASQVGSNLKKRLSTRYGDDPRRSSRTGMEMMAPMPEVPATYNRQQQQPYQGQDSYTGPVDYGNAADGVEEYTVDSQAGPSVPLIPPPARGDRRNGQATMAPIAMEAGLSQSSTGRQIAGPSSQFLTKPSASEQPSREPTLAWQGSALRELLEHNRQVGLTELLDLDALRQTDNFDGTEYLRYHLPPAMQPQAFVESLQSTKAAVKSDVKAQVFNHYADFIAISSQVSALENEMIELKSLLGEWRAMPRILEREDESGSKSLLTSATALNKRNSMLSLQQVYRAQLTSLWEGIANAQKFIPYKPGRHLIAEAPDFVELNAATYKPTRNVALFLLDDLLLIASRKKGRMASKVRLEAERCFALGDIVVVDLKDSGVKGGSSTAAAGAGGMVKDSIKIKKGKESFIYRAEKSESKKALLSAFRRVAEELATKKRKGTLPGGGPDGNRASRSGGDPRRQSIYAGMKFDKMSSGKSLLPDLAEGGDGEQDGVMKLASERIKEEKKDPHRWINDWSDGLAVDIALRRWEGACEKVGKGKAVLSTYTPSDPLYQVLSTRLSTQTAVLVSSLLSTLQSATLRKSSLVALASRLSSLGYSSIARQTFLTSREDLLRKRKRAIKFEGDTELYVAELSMVVFGMVRNTSEWFMAAWKEAGMASGFVKWALAQIHSFAITFRRQVYGGMQESKNAGVAASSFGVETASRAKAVAMDSARQLKDVGLDFGFVLEELLKSEEEQQEGELTRRLGTIGLEEQDLKSSSSTTAPLSINKSDSNVNQASTSQPKSSSQGVLGRVAQFEGASSTPLPPATDSTRPRRKQSINNRGGAPAIPSLTLTLADEASGISHRISSADVPAVHAQEFRRRSTLQMGSRAAGGAGGAASKRTGTT